MSTVVETLDKNQRFSIPIELNLGNAIYDYLELNLKNYEFLTSNPQSKEIYFHGKNYYFRFFYYNNIQCHHYNYGRAKKYTIVELVIQRCFNHKIDYESVLDHIIRDAFIFSNHFVYEIKNLLIQFLKSVSQYFDIYILNNSAPLKKQNRTIYTTIFELEKNTDKNEINYLKYQLDTLGKDSNLGNVNVNDLCGGDIKELNDVTVVNKGSGIGYGDGILVDVLGYVDRIGVCGYHNIGVWGYDGIWNGVITRDDVRNVNYDIQYDGNDIGILFEKCVNRGGIIRNIAPEKFRGFEFDFSTSQSIVSERPDLIEKCKLRKDNKLIPFRMSKNYGWCLDHSGGKWSFEIHRHHSAPKIGIDIIKEELRELQDKLIELKYGNNKYFKKKTIIDARNLKPIYGNVHKLPTLTQLKRGIPIKRVRIIEITPFEIKSSFTSRKESIEYISFPLCDIDVYGNRYYDQIYYLNFG